MSLASEIRYSARTLARAPGLTLALIMTVAVGAGGNAAIFGFIGGLITHPAPGADPADLVRFEHVARLLLVASAVVLVLASATVAGLLLSRSSARLLETAVKIALGATRARLARQCLVDSLLIAFTGGSLGVIVAWWTSRAFPMLFFAADAEQLALAPDITWLAAAAAVWIAVLAACGMVPVLVVPARDPSGVLRRDASAVSNFSHRMRVRLVVGQIALCSLLVVIAGVINEDLRATIRTSRGRVVGSLLVATVRNTAADFTTIDRKARALEGVTGVAWTSTLPAGRAPTQVVAVEPPQPAWREIRMDVATFSPAGKRREQLRAVAGRLFGGRDRQDTCRAALINEEAAGRYFDGDAVGRSIEARDGQSVEIVGVLASPPSDREAPPTLFYYDVQVPPLDRVLRDEVFRTARMDNARTAGALDVIVVSPEYTDVFADPPVAGRSFDARDTASTCRVALISAEGARALFNDRAIGGAVIDPDGERIEIVGVVRAEALGAARTAAAPMLFLPMAQAPRTVMTLAIRTGASSPASVAAAAVDGLAGTGSELLTPVASLEDHLLRTSLASARVATGLVGVSATMALVLSVAGVYAVMADLVVRRRRELALRMALGAAAWRLTGGIVREGLRLAAIGGAAGLAIAIASAPLLERIAVRPRLPGLVALGVAVMAVTALVAIACALPAWRAVSVDPRTVMHDE